jgi:hypothetical protein
MARPTPDQHNDYFAKYIDLVPGDDIVRTLQSQTAELMRFWEGYDEATAAQGPAGKWTVKQVLHHIADAERIFAYRALRIGRGDTTPLPGFEQDGYAELGGANARPWSSIVAEFAAVRRATLWLLETFPPEAWTRIGTSSNGPMTPLAAAYILAGHELHHVAILRGEGR